jgi:hypothetical protein
MKTEAPAILPGPLFSHNTTKVPYLAKTLLPIIDPHAVRVVWRGIATCSGDDAIAAEMFDAAPDSSGVEVNVRRDTFVSSVVAHDISTKIRRIKNGDGVERARILREVVVVRFDQWCKHVGRNQHARGRREAQRRGEIDRQAIRRQHERRMDLDQLPLIEHDAVVVPFARAVRRTRRITDRVRREADGVESANRKRAARRGDHEIGLSKS